MKMSLQRKNDFTLRMRRHRGHSEAEEQGVEKRAPSRPAGIIRKVSRHAQEDQHDERGEHGNGEHGVFCSYTPIDDASAVPDAIKIVKSEACSVNRRQHKDLPPAGKGSEPREALRCDRQSVGRK